MLEEIRDCVSCVLITSFIFGVWISLLVSISTESLINLLPFLIIGVALNVIIIFKFLAVIETHIETVEEILKEEGYLDG